MRFFKYFYLKNRMSTASLSFIYLFINTKTPGLPGVLVLFIIKLQGQAPAPVRWQTHRLS
jgi:hypothetical protein